MQVMNLGHGREGLLAGQRLTGTRVLERGKVRQKCLLLSVCVHGRGEGANRRNVSTKEASTGKSPRRLTYRDLPAPQTSS